MDTRAPAWLLGLLLGAGAACQAAPAAPASSAAASAFAGLPRPIVFAHRGGAGEAPEGTLEAIRRALAVDPRVAIELDLRATRDGHVVVLHDASVDRTTNGRGRVADFSLAALQALDAGHCATPGRGGGTARREACSTDEEAGPFPFRGRGVKIPTLVEALGAVPAGTLVLLEVKASGFEPRVAEIVRASGRLPRVVVGAGDDAIAERLRAALPEAAHFYPRRAAACIALATKVGAGAGRCDRYDLLALPTSGLGVDLATPAMLAALRGRGTPVAFFTVNTESELERLFRAGVDGVITDHPTRARAVLERLEAAAPARR